MMAADRIHVLYEAPVSKNLWQRMHWAKRGAIKKRWERDIWMAVNGQPRLPRPAARAEVTPIVYWGKPGPLPDFHNLEMAHEVVADGLVIAGMLKDDSKGQYIAERIQVLRAPRGETRTEIHMHFIYGDDPEAMRGWAEAIAERVS